MNHSCYNVGMDLKEIKCTPKKIELLKQMGIDSVEELLTHYPFRYEENLVRPFLEWKEGERIIASATICSRARVLRFKGNRSVTKFHCQIDGEEIECSIFNRPWTTAFPFGKTITVFGTYQGNHKLVLTTTNSLPIESQIGIQPVYNTKDGLSQNDWKKLIEKAFDACLETIEDRIPEAYRLKYRLLKRGEALYFIHKPISHTALKQALRTLKYEEFLLFQCCMQLKRAQNQQYLGIGKDFLMEDVEQLTRNLVFECTDDQKKAIHEILEDLRQEKTMMRLVQGDVGCGKTVVAAYACYASALAHKQSAFMAPTEILAKQHALNLSKMFEGLDVCVALYCSSLKKQEKIQILDDLAHHRIDVLVGTHALFQDDVIYDDLGLVIADEQHRFGVEQRRKLLQKGEKVDFLLMSATPIPRTLATSLFGDMDVSTIEQLPKGRSVVSTSYVKTKSMKPILKEVLQKIDEGNQCYVVCPAIEENEEVPMASVLSIYEGMKKTLTNYSVGLLHGQMKPEEKDAIMEAFVAKKIDILVSTTVIEVGVDVKDANIMIIYDAHRFGLSQIHQLRGRVGRGNKEGFCYLLSPTSDPESIHRLQTLVDVTDGFEIARQDLALRGPGDILGKRQSGVPGFILGDCMSDSNVLYVARDDAKEIVASFDDYPTLKNLCEMITRENKYVD